MSRLLCWEPFHLGAEFLLELPELSSKRLPMLIDKADVVVWGIMLDDTINPDIAKRHEEAAREYAEKKLCHLPGFFVYESDLAPLACALASLIPKNRRNQRKKTLKLEPPWSTDPIKLLSIKEGSKFSVTEILNAPHDNIAKDRYLETIPTCSLFILAWNYFRVFSGMILVELGQYDRSQMRTLFKQMALELTDSPRREPFERKARVLSFLNKSYDFPEERARIVGYFLGDEILRDTLSSRSHIVTEFYSMFDPKYMIEVHDDEY